MSQTTGYEKVSATIVSATSAIEQDMPDDAHMYLAPASLMLNASVFKATNCKFDHYTARMIKYQFVHK